MKRKEIPESLFLITPETPIELIEVVQMEKRLIKRKHNQGISLKHISEVLNKTYSSELKNSIITSSKITKIIGPVGKKKKTPKKTEKTPKK